MHSKIAKRLQVLMKNTGNKPYFDKSLDIRAGLLGMKSLTVPAFGQQKVNAVIWNLESRRRLQNSTMYMSN